MRTPVSLAAISACSVMLTVGAYSVLAQTPEMSVRYLRGAFGTIPLHENIVVTGQFVTDPGMVDNGWRYEGNPVSSFSIKAPKSNVTFGQMYVTEGSSAFKTLLDAKPEQLLRFHGVKAHGPSDSEAIYISKVELVQTLPPETNAPPGSAIESFRLIVTGNALTNRMVIPNVVPNRAYQVGGMTIVIEKQTSEANDIGIVQ